jgi:hypothetical protein
MLENRRTASAWQHFYQALVLRYVWWRVSRKVPKELRPPAPNIPLFRKRGAGA